MAETGDEARAGLRPEDLARFPHLGPDPESLGRLLRGLIERGTIRPPVYLVGECVTYDIAHGHPSFGAARHHGGRFVLWGQPGDPWPRLTIPSGKTSGFGKKKQYRDTSTTFEFDHVDDQWFDDPHGGYLDLQLTHLGSPVVRIGFYWSYSGHPNKTEVLEQIGAFAEAVTRCRKGLLPDGSSS